MPDQTATGIGSTTRPKPQSCFETLPDELLAFLFTFFTPFDFGHKHRFVCARWCGARPSWTKVAVRAARSDVKGVMHSIGSASKVTELEILGTFAAPRYHQRLTFLEGIAMFVGLRQLRLCWVNDELLRLIAGLEDLHGLQVEEHHHVTDGGLAHLPALQKLTRLKFDAAKSNTWITDQGVLVFHAMNSLEELVFGSWTKVSPRCLLYLAHFRSLRVLDLQLFEATIRDADLQRHYWFQNLGCVNFASCRRVTDAGVRHITASCRRLTSLNLSWTQVSDDICLALAELPLTELYLLDCDRFTGAGLRHLCLLNLRALEIRVECRYYPVLAHFQALRRFRVKGSSAEQALQFLPSTLEDLHLEADAILPDLLTFPSDLQVLHLDARFQTRLFTPCNRAHVRTLFLRRLTDASLGDVSLCSSLTTLHLDNCSAVSDAGLLQLKVLATLRVLAIDYGMMHNSCLLDIMTAVRKLQTLTLTFCRNITEGGVVRACERLPFLRALHLRGCVCISHEGKKRLFQIVEVVQEI